MQIAAMTSVFYSQRNNDSKIPAIESIRRLRKAGFFHIDLNLCGMSRGEQEFCGDNWKKQADLLRNEAEKLGVTFVQSHAPYYKNVQNQADKDEYEAYFKKMLLRSVDIIGMMGIRYSVVHPVQDIMALPEDKIAHLNRTRQIHLPFMEKARKLGIASAYENTIGRETPKGFCVGAEDLIMLCDAFKDFNAGVCWDFGHGNLSFEDQCTQISQLKGRVLCVHIHDNKGRNDDHVMPFMGNVPWEKVLPTMRKTGFSNELVLEVAQNANMPDELKHESTLLMAHASRLLIQMFEA